MKKGITLIALLLIFCMISENSFAQAKSISNSKISKNRVDQLLSKMTLEDKVGEMTQLSIDVLAVGEPYSLKEPFEFDVNKLKDILVEKRVGSILNAGGHAYDTKLWNEIISTIQEYATEKKESGIPVLYGIDAIHGVTYTLESTLFPQQLGQASTWNLELARQCGEVTAYETRASGIPWNFAPVLDIGRDARWPRLWETYGEDVLLCSEMGTAYINGLQGDDVSNKNNVSATLKHFLGYSVTLRGKDRMPAWIPERQLKEYIMPSFQAGIDAGAKSVMICSGELNGVPVHADKTILVDLLRDEMGFKGVAVTDWEDIGYLVGRHRIAVDFKDAIRLAINAGIDLAMVPMDSNFPILLKELVDEGKVPMSRIDESVARILQMKIDLGLFENPYYPASDYEFPYRNGSQMSYQAAVESLILLKNENSMLPMSVGAADKILIAGPNAANLNALNGGWSRTWQGTDPQYNTKGKLNIAEAFTKKYGDQVTVVQGQDLVKIKSKAAGASTVILCMGEQPYTEKVGDIDDLDLEQAQIDLVQEIKAMGKKVVVVLIEGRPRIVREMVDHADAILLGFLPGDEGGIAVRDVLIGSQNPSGKLPITYPMYSNDLVTYDHKGTDLAYRDFSMNGFKPQWEFGYGLSYTDFSYSGLTVASEVGMNDEINISVTVKNTGSKEGKEVVQLYVTDKVARITPSVKRLRGFEKVNLKAGEMKEVSFTITKDDLAFVGLENEWVTEAGEFVVRIGDQEATIMLVE